MAFVEQPGRVRKARKKVVRVVTVADLVSAVGQHGVLVPVGLAAVWRGCTAKAIRNRIARGSVTQFVVLGQQFVSVREVGGGSRLGN